MDMVRSGISTIQAAEQLLANQSRNVAIPATNRSDISFEQVLMQKSKEAAGVGDLRFSKHADARLLERSIHLTKSQVQRLNEGADKAGAKGIKDSLVIMDNLAFIVNTKSRTVITAMDQDYEKDNIYTNIDGAVIV